MRRLYVCAWVCAVCFLPVMSAEAASVMASTFGLAAKNLYLQFAAIAKFITGASYVAGLAFAIGAIMKFKQHKDSPTQVPVGTPIALVFIAGALLFFPTMLAMTGTSIFGTTTTAGPTGTLWGGA